MKATKNHDHFHSQAKEKTGVKSPGKTYCRSTKTILLLNTFVSKISPNSPSLLANFAKTVDQRGLLFSHFLTQTPNTSFPRPRVD